MPGHRANARALPSQVDIAIVTILPEEYEAVRRLLNNVRRDPGRKDQPNQYAWVVGEIEAVHGGTYQVALGMTVHPGNTSGGLAIVKTIARWHPRYVLLVGIAGGFPRDQLGLGDVVVSKQIIGYEYGKVEHNAFNSRPDFVYQVDGSLLRSALSVSTTNWRRGLGRRPGSDRGKSKVLVGVVASGEKVIDDRSADFFAAVEKLFPKLLAVEMEGAGAAAAIQEARDEGQTVGFLMIRGISDMPPGTLAETKKPSNGTKKNVLAVSDRDRWKSYAANAAAVFTVRFVSQAWPIPPRGELDQGITSSGPAAEDSTRPRSVIEQPRMLTRGVEEVSSVASEPNSANAGSQPRGSNINTIPIIIDGDDYMGRLLNIKIDPAHLARQVSCRELMELLNDRVATIPGVSGISTSVEFLCSKRRFGKGGRNFSAGQRSALVDRIGGEVGVYVEFVGSTSKELVASVGRRIEEIAGTAECMFLVSSAPSLVPVLRRHRRQLKVVVLELRHDLPSELRNEAYATLELEDDLPGLFSYSYPRFDVRTLGESTCAELYSEADDRHSNQLRVTRSGTVFLSKDEVGSENIDGLRFRFETFCAGNGYVGPIVASKSHYVQEQLADIQNAWKTGRTGYIDY